MTPNAPVISDVKIGPAIEIVFENSARFVPSVELSEPEIVQSPQPNSQPLGTEDTKGYNGVN